MSENTPNSGFDMPPQEAGRTGAASEEEAGFQPPPGEEVPQAESAAIAADVLALAPSELLDVKRAIEEQLIIRAAGPPSTFSVQSFSGSQNILGVGVGVGITDEADAATVNMGEPGAPSLVLYVAEPTSPDEVRSAVADSVGASSSAVDARAVDQVPIRYVRTGPIDALAHRFRDRPASGGISVGHFKVTAGTIGCFATGRSAPRNARLLMLSNNHVLANANSAMFGDCICQPGIYDGGRCPDDQIAVLERYVPIDFSGPNFVDCATGWCWPNRVRRDLVVLSGGSRSFFKIGSAPIAPAVGLAVAKSGRTTQLTSGHITAVGVTVNVNYSGGRVASFQDQIAISSTAGNFSQGGDSGSAIFKNDTTRQPVGLLFAGGSSTTFANRMDRVLSALDIVLSVLTSTEISRPYALQGGIMTSIHARQTGTSSGQMESPPGEDTGNDAVISAEAAAQYVTQNASATAAEGLPRGFSFMIRDEPGYRIRLSVEDLGAQDAMEIVLRTAEYITWWKSLSYFPHVQGGRGYGPEIRIETKNRVHEARQLLYLPDITRYGILELWKGGIGGFGAFAGSLAIDAAANTGSSVMFEWLED